MKRILQILFMTMMTLPVLSQAPEGFSYHAIVRDNIGNPLTNQAVSFRFSILQGSPVGASVFQEIHNVTTDDFGAVSLIINNGTGKVGIFETIAWGGDRYYLKVEIDNTGGTVYSDMGTTQLLSVPYALFAKESGNSFSGDYNNLINKPVTDGSETKVTAGNNMIVNGSGTIAQPYVITNGFSGSYNDLTNKPVTDGSETKLTAGKNIVLEGTGTIADPYVVTNSLNGSETIISTGSNLIFIGSGTLEDPYVISERVHSPGESWGGGIVFYVYDNGRHGLIAALADQDPAIEWYNGTRRYTNTTGDGVGAGEMNTTLIISLQTGDNPTGNFAAKVCADYTATVDGVTYGDWYLPSRYELALLFSQKDMVGGFSNGYYWSSTEFSSVSAWCQDFTVGIMYNLNKSIPYSVRAIRAF